MKKSFYVEEKLCAQHKVTIESDNLEDIEKAMDAVDMEYVGISDYIFLLRQQPSVYVECEEGTDDPLDELEFIGFTED